MIIITGASRGLGKYLFERFVSENDKVIGLYNSTIPESRHQDVLFKVDITNEKNIKDWLSKVSECLEDIVLINCAGINYNSYAHKADISKWSKVIEVNLIGSFNIIHALLPIMRNDGFGRIINFSSVVAQIGVPGTSAYAASKAGLWGLTRSIAVENAKHGITINNLNLGYFNAGMIEQVSESFLDLIKNKIPTGELGSPYIIYNTIKYLVDNNYINGTSIDINGGLF